MLYDKFKELDLNFDELFYERCEKYIRLLQEWGAVHNLTGALHSVQIKDNNIIDIGTGAGYPGIVNSYSLSKY